MKEVLSFEFWVLSFGSLEGSSWQLLDVASNALPRSDLKLEGCLLDAKPEASFTLLSACCCYRKPFTPIG